MPKGYMKFTSPLEGWAQNMGEEGCSLKMRAQTKALKNIAGALKGHYQGPKGKARTLEEGAQEG